jgi:hypothetical protein
MGKSTISMAIFNSYVKLPEGISFSENGDFIDFIIRYQWGTNWEISLCPNGFQRPVNYGMELG